MKLFTKEMAVMNRNLMRSKNIYFLITLFVVLHSSASFAQSYPTEIEVFQKVFGIEKKVALANFMKMDASNNNFWKIYDQYETKRQELGKERIAIIMDYAGNYTNLSDEKILELFKRSESLKKSFDKLQTTYFNKIKKEVGIGKAAQFWQFEGYIYTMTQAEIYSKIPFIGENPNGK